MTEPDKAVIFDMDGVLIDSEPAYLEMNKKLFADFGIKMDGEDYKALVGLPSIPMWTMLKKKYDLKNEVSDFLMIERKRMHEILDSDIISKPIEGVTELLGSLKERNLKLSIASSSAKENVNFIISKLNLTGYFDFIISGEEVKNGKPSPDIFLAVSGKFRISPDKCYVIEDSANGIIAARSAGMKCIGFTNNDKNSQDLSGSDFVLKNFNKNSRDLLINYICK